MIERRNLRVLRYLIPGLLGACAIAFAPFLVLTDPWRDELGTVDPARIMAIAISGAAATVWAVVFSSLGFRSADEFAQQGRRVAWYWGSRLGLAVSAPVATFIALGGLHFLGPAAPAGRDLTRAFAIGYGLPLISQAVGFLAVRIWWRLSRR